MCREAPEDASSSAVPVAAQKEGSAASQRASMRQNGSEHTSDGFFGFSAGVLVGGVAGALMMYASCMHKAQ